MSIDIVFDGPPSHESGRFVEVEDEHRRGIRIGEWIERDDGLWALRIPDPREFTRLESENAELRAEVERAYGAIRHLREAKRKIDLRDPDVQTAIDNLTAADEALFALLPTEGQENG